VKDAFRLLRGERDVRLFFAALAQSSLGTGAAYVALLLIAYERFRSPWAISLVLLAEFLPVMVLGPLLGGAVDRWSRRWCVVLADIVRALAFVGIAFVDSFALTLVFALVAGAGTALFRPAALAGLPSLVSPDDGPRAIALFSAVAQVGWTTGPALAAGSLLLASPEVITAANGATFAISALILVGLPLDHKTAPIPRDLHARTSLFREGISGWKEVVRLIDLRIVVVASSIAMFFGGIFNVAEPLFATQTLMAGDAGYSILVSVYGLGFIVGSLVGSSGGEPSALRRRYLQGLGLTGVGSLFTALSPTLAVALAPFILAGAGNGMLVVHERLLIQKRVPEALFGRAFGLTEAMVSWALVASFLTAGLLSSVTNPRGLIYIVAAGELLLAALALGAMRSRAPFSGPSLEPSPSQAGN
jgi:MFS family permease